MTPSPLPELIPFSEYENNWDKYLATLYSIYLSDLVNSGLQYNNIDIRYRYMPPYDGKGFGFWHLISEGDDEDERLPVFERCERLHWIRWMILEAGQNPDILIFESKRGSSKSIVLWNPAIHFAVILGRRTGYFLLLTAYPTKPGREMSFMEEWKKHPIKG